MKKIIFVVIGLVFAAVLVGYFILKTPQTPKLKIITVGTTKISAEVADTDLKKERGLSYRPSLLADQGMIFTFQEKGKYAFWMKGMNFPLDFIYVNDHKVVEVKENVPNDNLTPFSPGEFIDAVIEVNAGFVKNNSISVGQDVLY